ncbi:hypothetical protein AWB78_08182 [Caballeronia calidae]|uniref:Uncharacterized protein n=1 Tax=Caballeronia calidae TaxID=1777139 RepID=A0A158EIW6_9BURK|nr:hypothetical protein [Caballeronia calidae]SAL06670.1 hypothetical protein AWB78_08182 [Caballeronia calidae]
MYELNIDTFCANSSPDPDARQAVPDASAVVSAYSALAGQGGKELLHRQSEMYRPCIRSLTRKDVGELPITLYRSYSE